MRPKFGHMLCVHPCRILGIPTVPLGHFSIDAFVVDACVEAKVEVLFYDCASDVTNRCIAQRRSSKGLVGLG